jgi:very-short-patch-repair endonuclease
VVAIRLDVEVDGPHHLLAAQREKDHVRDRKVRRARWTVERFSTEMIDLRPTVFEAQVTDIVKHLVAALSS